jgi:hypothetical protein
MTLRLGSRNGLLPNATSQTRLGRGEARGAFLKGTELSLSPIRDRCHLCVHGLAFTRVQSLSAPVEN